MPPKVLPVPEDIEKIFKVLKPRNFYVIQGLQRFRARTKDECAIPPRPRKGAELGFAVDKDDLAAIGWTSWVPGYPEAREEDLMWIIIEQNSKMRYCLSIRRTKNCVEHFILEARIARCRIRTRPVCAVCKIGMSIVYGKGIGSRFWRCSDCRAREDWDHKEFLRVLSSHPEAVKYLARRRSKRKAGYDKCHAAGNPIKKAIFIRKRWRRISLPVTGV